MGRGEEEGKWDRGRDCSGGMKGRREGRNSPGEEKIVLGSGGGGGGVDEGGKKGEDLLCTLRRSVEEVGGTDCIPERRYTAGERLTT